ncbi:hypothetical protein [Streptantibioticus ferralitis]|uniref:Uncharacterized protein n=1 Tax=Streptantibioticus ferralitis TaxID=236510 RepID=A0ABT5Z0Q2_9ACTN|nr:hypothetical protein [Streptantibioticus ferralitis]MDF2257426.1 hypothetical protein [Streptantibioticus ferralitis]
MNDIPAAGGGSAQPPLFDYQSPTKPSPLDVTVEGAEVSRGKLRITVTNTTSTTHTCDTLTFALAVGGGAAAFTAAHKAADIQITHPSGWALETVSGRTGVFEASPNDEAAADVPRNTPLEFVLSNIAVNTAPGTAELVVTEKTIQGGTRVGETKLYCPKATGGLRLADFRPTLQVIPAGDKAELTWKFTPVEGAKVDLHYFDAAEGKEKKVSVSGDRNHQVRLYEDTSFMLHAYVGPEAAPTVSYQLYTFVTVSLPYLRTKDLTVVGAASLLGRARPHTTRPRLTPEPSVTTVNLSASYTAETDGLLTGSVRTFFEGTNAQLAVTVKPPNATGTEHTAYVYCADDVDSRVYAPGPNLAMPVPKGSTVDVDWKLVRSAEFDDAQHAGTHLFATTMEWHPWGTGKLVPMTTV